jgi:hypothetical protein
MTMPAGTYYIGDLCYVMKPEWEEFCDITIEGYGCKDGEFTLKDGRKFATYGTLYGDGTYRSNIGSYHSVDAGLIGCIRIEDIRDPEATEEQMRDLGTIVEFDEPFETSEAEGVITFGCVEIDTAGDSNCDEDEYEYDEEE